jgi:hypothetical protein
LRNINIPRAVLSSEFQQERVPVGANQSLVVLAAANAAAELRNPSRAIACHAA